MSNERRNKRLKRNAEYWKARSEQVEQAQHERGAAAMARISALFRQAQKDIEAKIDAWYRRFAKNNGITLAEAKKQLNAKELAELRWDVNEYIKHGRDNAVSGEWLRELENASARAHISRLEALKLQCGQSVEALFAGEQDETESAMRDVYEDGYYRTAYEIQKGTGVGEDFAALDKRRIDKVINEPWAADGRDFSERIWANREKLKAELGQTLTQSIIRGEDPQKAIDAIAERLGVSKAQAGRLVMTEQAYFASLAQADSFKELGVEKYEIVATLDNATSEICREMDGRVFEMSEREAGVTAPPFHPWCRTTTAPYFEDDFDVPGERAARDEEGKTYYVPADMTYEQWAEKYVKDAETPIEKSSAVQYNRDREQYGRYKSVLGDLAPDSFEEFQKIKQSDPVTYGALKHQYRALNAYESNAGQMDKQKIVDLYDKTLETKRQFTGAAKKRSNTAVMEIDGQVKIANSKIATAESPFYKNFEGDKSQIVLAPEKPKFTATVVGSHLRDVDSEKKLLEYAATVAEDGKPHTINLFSERCMCESCRGVLDQFQKAYPKVTINVVSGKAERVSRNRNNPMKHLV